MNVPRPGHVPLRAVKGLLHLGLWLGVLVGGACQSTPEGPPPLPDRVFLVGVESLSRSHLDALLDRGELPHLERIVDGGTRVDVESTLPLERTSLWATALSGKVARKHGVMGPFVDLPTQERALPPSSMRRSMLLWQVLGANRIGSAVVGFPNTWPVEIVSGFLVSEMVVPSRWNQTAEVTFQRVPGYLETFPPSLFAEIEDRIQSVSDLPREDAARFFTLTEDEYRMLYDEPLGSVLRGDNPPRDVALSVVGDRSRMDIALHLADAYRPRLIAVHQDVLAAVQTSYWPFTQPEVFRTQDQFTRRFKGTVDEGYRHLDTQLGRILETMTPRDVLAVVSVNGFGTVAANPGTEARSHATTTPDATLLLFGHGIRKGSRVPNAELPDVAPTLLGLLGVEVAGDMDGSPLTAVYTDAFAAAHPRQFRDSYDMEWDPATRYPKQVEQD